MVDTSVSVVLGVNLKEFYKDQTEEYEYDKYGNKTGETFMEIDEKYVVGNFSFDDFDKVIDYVDRLDGDFKVYKASSYDGDRNEYVVGKELLSGDSDDNLIFSYNSFNWISEVMCELKCELDKTFDGNFSPNIYLLGSFS